MTFLTLLSSPQLIQHPPTPTLFLVRKCLSRGIAGRTHYSLIKVNCIVYAMNPATCCNVSYVATQFSQDGPDIVIASKASLLCFSSSHLGKAAAEI